MRRIVIMTVLFVFLLLVSSCMDFIPKISPNGKYAAVMFDFPEFGSTKLGIVEIETKKLTLVAFPDGWEPEGFKWTGKKLLVAADKRENKPHYWFVEPATGKCRKTNLEVEDGLPPPFIGKYNEKPCIYFPNHPEKEKTLVTALDNLSEVFTTLDFMTMDAGNGYFIATVIEKKEEKTEKRLNGIDIYTPGAKKPVRINKAELAKAINLEEEDAGILFARVSSDHTVLVLVFLLQGKTYKTKKHFFEFAAYKISNGKFLWSRLSNNMFGYPAVVKDRIYAIEAKNPDKEEKTESSKTARGLFDHLDYKFKEAVIAVHTEKGRKIILDLPLKKADRVMNYSASDDRSKFVLQVMGKNPRLMIIPIKDSIKTEEIIEIPLKK